MAEQSENTQPGTRQGRNDRLVKWIFAGIAVVVAFAVWQMQKRDPEVKFGLTDFDRGLARAREQNGKVVVLFTDNPMGHRDKQIVEQVINTQRTPDALEKGNFVLVHLNTEDHAEPAQKYEAVGAEPVFVVVEPDGTMVSKHDASMMNPEDFHNTVLDVVVEADEGEPNATSDANQR
ncbi:MAG: hypothetical protein ACOC93_01810 [Planctomycetota bacterium]